jgi:hypothetical protein
MRAAAIVIVLAARGAAASPTAEVEVAKDTAYKAFEISDYDTAIAQYKRAYLLTSDPRLFYNLALSHRKRFQLTGSHADLVEARDYFHRFVELLDPDDPAHAAERERLEQMRDLARSYINELETELATHPAQPSPPPLATTTVIAPPRPHASRPWIPFAVAGSLALAGGVTGVLALEYDGDASDARKLGDIDRSNTLGDKAHRYAIGSDVMVGGALVAGAVGLYLLLAPHDTPPSRIGLVASPFGIALGGRY